MNNDTIDAIAARSLIELAADAREENSPLNDDDFADFAEIELINSKIEFTHDDLAIIARRMITICDALNINH